MEYNVSIWSPQNITGIRLSENIQKKFTRYLCKKLNIKYSNYTNRLQILKIESLEYRRLKYDMIVIYKILNNLIDINMNDFFTISDIHKQYELRRHTFYLKGSNDARTTIRRNFFSFRSINTWNKLPNHIVSSPNLSIFKSRINKFSLSNIYKFVYQPCL